MPQVRGVGWRRDAIPLRRPQTQTLQRDIRRPDVRSVRLTEVGGGGGAEGRVNISYTYYQTESLISIPSKPPQVMLKRLCGNRGGWEFQLKKGDWNLNKLRENYREKKIQKLIDNAVRCKNKLICQGNRAYKGTIHQCGLL